MGYSLLHTNIIIAMTGLAPNMSPATEMSLFLLIDIYIYMYVYMLQVRYGCTMVVLLVTYTKLQYMAEVLGGYRLITGLCMYIQSVIRTCISVSLIYTLRARAPSPPPTHTHAIILHTHITHTTHQPLLSHMPRCKAGWTINNRASPRLIFYIPLLLLYIMIVLNITYLSSRVSIYDTNCMSVTIY